MVVMELNKIDPMSAGKAYAGIMFIFAAVYAAIMIIVTLLFGGLVGTGGLMSAVGISLIMLIAMPIMGFIMGALGAFLYDVIAERFAKVKVELVEIKVK